MNKGIIVHKPEDTKRQVVHQILTGLKTVSDQSGKHRSIEKMARFTDLQGVDLRQAVGRLSQKEKGDMMKAFAELDRVAHAVATKN